MRVLLFGKVSYYTMDTGSRIKLVREHRGLTQQKLGEMLGYGKSSANRIAQYDFKFGLTAKATFSYNYTNSRFDQCGVAMYFPFRPTG